MDPSKRSVVEESRSCKRFDGDVHGYGYDYDCGLVVFDLLFFFLSARRDPRGEKKNQIKGMVLEGVLTEVG